MRGIAGPHIGGTGGFSEGGAVRRPQTLVGPVVSHPELTHPATVTTPKPVVPAKFASTRAPSTKATAVDKTSASPKELVVQ
jgi:hypothetical protein